MFMIRKNFQLINIKQNLYITKKKSEADFIVSICADSDTKVAPLKELKDPSDTHKYSFRNVVTAIQERLKKEHVKLGYKSGFNQYVLSLIIDFSSKKMQIVIEATKAVQID